ncbi:unnamed protein product [Rhizoctonia solani]|uniref:Cell wall galactomannoprotein n=1 Tax=Rhizoctonia solani TaxID=456999 RepID=A0A8H3ECS3_9AGAM|nr:unnamed protein product [Rhizoctonia solani]CAE7224117.1 unnamed protein product [Rhizoctonia solani]
MLFSRAAFSILALSPFIGVFASTSTRIELQRRQNASSMAAVFSDAQSKIDTLIPIDTQPISDPELALTTMSQVFDYTNIVTAAMDTFNGGDENLLIDLDGKKLDDVQMSEKVVQLWQSIGRAASLVKGSGSGSVATMIQVTALTIGLCADDISRVAEGVAKLPNVLEAAKTNQELMTGIVDSMLGPEFNLD